MVHRPITTRYVVISTSDREEEERPNMALKQGLISGLNQVLTGLTQALARVRNLSNDMAMRTQTCEEALHHRTEMHQLLTTIIGLIEVILHADSVCAVLQQDVAVTSDPVWC